MIIRSRKAPAIKSLQFDDNSPPEKSGFFYGWIIVAAATILQAIQFGIAYSYGIFFKPLVADFGWSRGDTSGVYSVMMISGAISATYTGWLADRFSPRKVITVCGLFVGAGLVLSSQVSEMWQLYITFGVMQGAGVGGIIPITTGIIARWFTKRRGLALGIASAGSGLGTLIFPVIIQPLIAASGWSTAFLMTGIATWVIILGSGFLIRRDPQSMGYRPYGAEILTAGKDQYSGAKSTYESGGVSFRTAIRTRPLWMLAMLFFLFNICVQLVMVHLVNYATDLQIDPFKAATIVSVIGIGSISGRLLMGAASDRIGANKALVICCLALTGSFVWLIFSQQLWMLYLFAVIFSFAYGGEVPQIPLLAGQFFGVKAVMAVTGLLVAATRLGGALGSWLGGAIYDFSNSYITAFTVTVIAGAFMTTLAFALIRSRPAYQTDLDSQTSGKKIPATR